MLSNITSFLSNTFLGDGVDDQEGEQRGQTDDETRQPEVASASRYLPTIKDVLVVKAMLLKGKRLPIEMVDLVLDHAEYWPHTTAFVEPRPGGNGLLSIYGGQHDNENRFLVGTPCSPPPWFSA